MKRGAGWVAAQVILMALYIFAPAFGPEWLAPRLWMWVGGVLGAAGVIPFAGGALALGRNLTPFPRPGRSGELVTSGLFGLMRHPIYGGGVLVCLGGALATRSWSRLMVSAVIALFLDAKARREETILCEMFPQYPDYRRRVKRLIPFIY